MEASLHNLLTRLRLTRVLTHCTWEKTTVAISRPGSKIGRYGSGTLTPKPTDDPSNYADECDSAEPGAAVRVDMVAREGEVCGASWLFQSWAFFLGRLTRHCSGQAEFSNVNSRRHTFYWHRARALWTTERRSWIAEERRRRV